MGLVTPLQDPLRTSWMSNLQSVCCIQNRIKAKNARALRVKITEHVKTLLEVSHAHVKRDSRENTVIKVLTFSSTILSTQGGQFSSE